MFKTVLFLICSWSVFIAQPLQAQIRPSLLDAIRSSVESSKKLSVPILQGSEVEAQALSNSVSDSTDPAQLSLLDIPDELPALELEGFDEETRTFIATVVSKAPKKAYQYLPKLLAYARDGIQTGRIKTLRLVSFFDEGSEEQIRLREIFQEFEKRNLIKVQWVKIHYKLTPWALARGGLIFNFVYRDTLASSATSGEALFIAGSLGAMSFSLMQFNPEFVAMLQKKEGPIYQFYLKKYKGDEGRALDKAIEMRWYLVEVAYLIPYLILKVALGLGPDADPSFYGGNAFAAWSIYLVWTFLFKGAYGVTKTQGEGDKLIILLRKILDEVGVVSKRLLNNFLQPAAFVVNSVIFTVLSTWVLSNSQEIFSLGLGASIGLGDLLMVGLGGVSIFFKNLILRVAAVKFKAKEYQLPTGGLDGAIQKLLSHIPGLKTKACINGLMGGSAPTTSPPDSH